MVGFIYDIVRNVTVFLILAGIIMSLFGSKDYLKYVSLFVGTILILIVAKPLFAWLSQEDALLFRMDLRNFAADNTEWESRIQMADEKGRNRIVKEYKKKIEEQIRWILEREQLYLVKAVITLEEDAEEEDYGNLQTLHVTAALTEAEDPAVGEVSIDRIRITEEGEVEEYDGEREASLEMRAARVKKELVALFRLDEPDVYVHLE